MPHRRLLAALSLPLAACVALAIGACGDGSADPPAGDGPGPDVVVSPDVGAAAIRVAADPSASIGGGEEEGSPYLLGRVNGVGRLQDGRIVLVDVLAGEVRLFESDGSHVWTFGRPGEGPGEFQQPRYVGQASDGSILIWDDRSARITELTPDGELEDVRQTGSLVEQIAPRPRFVLENDLLLGSFPGQGAQSEFEHGEIVDDFSRMYLTDMDYTERTFVTEMSGARFQVFLDPDPTFVAMPFTAAANFAPSGDHVLAVARDTRGVSVFASDGRRVREMWVDRPPRPVTEVDWEGERARRLQDVPEDEVANEERRLNRLDLPTVMPTYDRVRDDGADRIWARRYLPDLSETPTWDLFSRAGRFEGSIETPARFEVDAVGPDWLLGTRYDEFFVPTVQLFRLEGS